MASYLPKHAFRVCCSAYARVFIRISRHVLVLMSLWLSDGRSLFDTRSWFYILIFAVAAAIECEKIQH